MWLLLLVLYRFIESKIYPSFMFVKVSHIRRVWLILPSLCLFRSLLNFQMKNQLSSRKGPVSRHQLVFAHQIVFQSNKWLALQLFTISQLMGDTIRPSSRMLREILQNAGNRGEREKIAYHGIGLFSRRAYLLQVQLYNFIKHFFFLPLSFFNSIIRKIWFFCFLSFS